MAGWCERLQIDRNETVSTISISSRRNLVLTHLGVKASIDWSFSFMRVPLVEVVDSQSQRTSDQTWLCIGTGSDGIVGSAWVSLSSDPNGFEQDEYVAAVPPTGGFRLGSLASRGCRTPDMVCFECKVTDAESACYSGR